MYVRDYMQSNPITVTPEERLHVAHQLMQTHRIRHLPVIDTNGKLVGVITDRDLRQAEPSDEPHLAEHELTYLLAKVQVKDMMTQEVVTVRAETPVAEAARIFLEKKFGCLPVVREDHTLAGIITVSDLLRAYVEQHQTATQSA